jgi:hypothetical protein
MLNEAFRILRSGGKLVLQVPWQWWIHEAPYDYFRYTPYGLKHLLNKAGFVDVRIDAQAGYFTATVLKFNYFSNRFIRGPKPLRYVLLAALVPIWWLGQKIAPTLDMLDQDWAAETPGFWVVANKS